MDKAKQNLVEIPLGSARRVPPVTVVNPGVASPIRKPAPPQAAKQDKNFAMLVYGVLIAAFVLGGYTIFTGPLAGISRAVLPAKASATSSMILGYPLTIPADGTTASTLDIFIADDSGTPLANRKVEISVTLGEVTPASAMTDQTGHASYKLTMSEPGISTINVTVDGTPLNKKLTIKGE